MFSKKTKAILWEIYRTNRAAVLTSQIGQLFFVVVFFVMITFIGRSHDSTEAPVLSGMFVMMSMAGSAFSQFSKNTFDNSLGAFTYRQQFTKPVSTVSLVLLPMLAILVTTPIIYLVTASFFNLLIGANVPLIKPAAIVFAGSSCLLAAAWAPSTNAGRAWSLGGCLLLFSIVSVMFHFRREYDVPMLMVLGSHEYFEFQWWHWMVLVLTPILSIAGTVVAVSRQRRGETWGFAALARSRDRRKPLSYFHFSSRLRAQLWYEMRRFGSRIVLMSLVLPLLPLIVITFVSYLDPNWDKASTLWIAFILFSPIAYQIAGIDGATGFLKEGDTWRFSAFDATRSMKNDDLVFLKVSVTTIGSLIGLGWMVGSCCRTWLFSMEIGRFGVRISRRLGRDS